MASLAVPSSTDQSGTTQDNENYNFSQVYLGQHDSARVEPPSDLQYAHLLNLGVSIRLTPAMNGRVSNSLPVHLCHRPNHQ